jgi:dolichol-phosphate mannosyltransferase
LDQPVPDLNVLPVMDSYSRDMTRNIVEDLFARDPRIQLLINERSTGVVSCYLHGFRHAVKMGADYVIEMDGGGSHDPKSIPEFVRRLDQGYDCVFSTRFALGGRIVNHPLRRRLVSKIGTILANGVLGTHLSDMTSGYEGFRASVLRAIDEQIGFDEILSLRQASHFIQTELRYYCCRLRYCENPIIYVGSTSTLRNRVIINSLKALFLLRRRTPIFL